MIKKTQLVVIAGPALSVAADWKDGLLLQYGTGAHIRSAIENFLRDHELSPRLVAEIDDAVFLVEVAAQGRHLAIVPKAVARAAIAAGRVRVLEVIDLDDTGVYATHRATTSSEIVRAAIRLMVDAYRR